MMNTAVGRSAILALLVCSDACGSSGPTSPSRISESQPPPSPPPARRPRPPISFPPASGPSRTFIFDSELAYPVRDFTRQSHFVLYDNGAFVLQYPPSSLGDGTFRGQYRDAIGVIMFLFEFQGRSVDDARDDATGHPQGQFARGRVPGVHAARRLRERGLCADALKMRPWPRRGFAPQLVRYLPPLGLEGRSDHWDFERLE